MDNLFLLGNNAFNHNIGDLDVGRVRLMKNMFRGAKNFNQNLSKWDVRNVISMDGMFDTSASFNSPLFKVDALCRLLTTNKNMMFYDVWSFDGDRATKEGER